MNGEVLAVTGVRESDVAEVERRERDELERRAALYRANRPPIDLAGKTAVIVDDGIATGSTAAAAAQIARQAGAERVIIATPVAPPITIRRLAHVADDVIAVRTPENFFAIGEWYADFSQTSDDEVRRLLGASGSADVGLLVVTPRKARAGAGDLLDHGVMLAQGMGTSVAGLALATAYVAAGRAGAQVEGAAAFLAGRAPAAPPGWSGA